jgi:hypothetical protein
MPLVNQTRYQPIVDDLPLIARIEHSHASQISQLEEAGFERFLCVREAANVNLFLLPIMGLYMRAKGEIIRLRLGRYRIEMCYPVLVHRSPVAFGSISKLGVTFSTPFVDGSILMTVNTVAMQSDEKARQKIADERAFHHFYHETTMIETWDAHQQHLADMQASGYQTVTELTFEDFARIGLRLLEAGFDVKVRK